MGTQRIGWGLNLMLQVSWHFLLGCLGQVLWVATVAAVYMLLYVVLGNALLAGYACWVQIMCLQSLPKSARSTLGRPCMCLGDGNINAGHIEHCILGTYWVLGRYWLS